MGHSQSQEEWQRFCRKEIRKSIRGVRIRETRCGGAHGPVECAPHIPRVQLNLLYVLHSCIDALRVVQGMHRLQAMLPDGTVSCRVGLLKSSLKIERLRLGIQTCIIKPLIGAPITSVGGACLSRRQKIVEL